MEVTADELSDLLGMEGYVVAEGAVVEASELRDDTVDHGLGEDAVALEDRALLLQTVGRGCAAVGQGLQFDQFLFVDFVVDIHGYIRPGGHLQSTGHLQSVEQSYTDACKHLIGISRTVGRPNLKGLLAAGVIAPFGSSGLALWHISTPEVQPSGTRTSTERLRSPQQIFVGAS